MVDWDVVPESVMLLSREGRVCFVNRCFKKRVTKFEVTALSFCRDLVHSRNQTSVQEAIDKAASSGDVLDVSCDVLIISGDNEFPLYDPFDLQLSYDPRTGYTAVSLRRRKQSILPAKCQDDDVMDYINNAPIALQWLSETGHVLWCNDTALDLLGYTREEYIGKHMYAFSMDNEETLQKNFAILKRGGVMHNHASDWKTKSGDMRHVLIDSSIHFDEHGKFRNTRCFIRDDTARQIQCVRMEAERVSAVEAMRSQDRFLRKVLHEIRTPCNVILQSLDKTDVEAQMRRLLRIVRDVEDAHAFDSGKAIALRPSKFSLPALLRDVFWSAAAERPSADVRRSIEVLAPGNGAGPGIPCDVVTDRGCVARVVTHLCENAMRYARPGGFVRLEVGRGARGQVAIAVANSGKALDEERVHNHFQHYWHCSRAPPPDPSNPAAAATNGSSGLFGEADEGLGVGLNICFNIVQCLGSQLWVTSARGVNTFRFELAIPIASTVPAFDFSPPRPPPAFSAAAKKDPAAAAAAAAAAGERALAALAGGVPSWIDVEDAPASGLHLLNSKEQLPPEMGQVSQTCEAGNQEPRRPHILVVDDNTICQKVLCRTLRSLDCTTSVAGNGKVACEMVRDARSAYDLVFMDLRMPVCDGIEACNIMRRDLTVKVPIVALSADTTEEVRQRCSQVGMNFFCPKPATKQQINEVVKSYVKL